MKHLFTFPLVAYLVLASFYSAAAQAFVQQPNALAQLIEQQRAEGVVFQPVDVFTDVEPTITSSYFKKAVFFGLDKQQLKQLLENRTPTILFKIPIGKQQVLELELTEKSILTPDFKVTLSSGEVIARSEIKSIFYRGIIKGKPNSLAAISIFEDEIVGVISDETGNYNLGRMPKLDNLYVFYNDRELTEPNTFECHTQEDNYVPPKRETLKNMSDLDPCRGAVEFYLVTRYQFFVNKGNMNGVINYVTGFFNVTAVLYANEGIPVEISSLFVHTTADPYPHDSTGFNNVAGTFANTIGYNFDGDVAHLLSSSNSGFMGVGDRTSNFCGNNFAYTRVRNDFANYPNYSGTVYIFTHEAGHQLGSPHTHGCYWGPNNNQQIDDCGNVAADNSNMIIEGNTCYTPNNPILPYGNGTIMSYCHHNAGINFTLGFGTEPGDLIRTNYLNVNCVFLEPNLTIQNVNGSIPAGNYKANSTLTSNGKVASGSTVTFSAGGSIVLQPGFHAQAGSNFTAQLLPCRDGCTNVVAPVVSCGQNISGFIGSGDGVGVDISDCTAQGGNLLGKFYEFQGTGDEVTLDICGYFTAYVFTGTCGNLVCVAETDTFIDFCELDEECCYAKYSTTFSSTPGTTYKILIADYSPGAFNFSIGCSAAIIASPNALIAEAELPTEKSGLHIYPNPATNEAVISYQLSKNSRVRLEILDLTGRSMQVLLNDTQSAAGRNDLSWSFNTFQAGTYILRLQTENQQWIEKFVLIK